MQINWQEVLTFALKFYVRETKQVWKCNSVILKKRLSLLCHTRTLANQILSKLPPNTHRQRNRIKQRFSFDTCGKTLALICINH